MNCPQDRRIQISGESLAEVEDFCYLGGILTQFGGSVEDVAGRLQKTRGAFENLSAVWKSKELSLSTNMTFYCSIVETTFLYGCECWTLTKNLEKRIRVFQRRFLRRILMIFYPTVISNVELLRTTGQVDIAVKVTERKWWWIGHIARKDPHHLTWSHFNVVI